MERELRLQYERFDQAVNHMSHGLAMFGPDERLIVCNAQYLEMYGLDPAIAKPGISSRDLLSLWVGALDEPNVTAEELYERRKRASAGGKLSTMRLHLKDGRVIEATTRPTPDGGWVTAHEDVTDRVGYEQALREQNILFDAALENMAHGLCMLDKDWRVVVRNRRYLEMYGLTPEETQPGTPVLEVIRAGMARGTHETKQSAEEYLAAFQQRAAESKDGVIDRRVVIRGRLLAVRHQQMANGGWVGTFEDITEREHAAEELSEQYRRFDAALENMAHGLCMFDKDWRVIVHNQRFLELYGLSPEAVQPGTPLVDLIRFTQENRVHASSGQTPEEVLEDFKRRLAHKQDGEPAMVRRFADGRLIAIRYQALENGHQVCTYEDITERERAAEELKEQHSRFDIALNNMAHGLCMFDKDWRVVVRNRRYLELYGLGPNDAQPGTPLLEMMRQSIDRGMHTGKATAEKFFADFIKRVTVDREPVVHRRLTSGRLLAVRHEPMENGGWVGTYEDITERERAAEELKEQHSRFDIALNNMAHGLCMFDQNMHLIVSNKRYAEMFNLDPAKVRPGMSVYDVIGLSFAVGNHSHREFTLDEFYNNYVTSLREGNLIAHRHLADGRIIKVTHERMAQGGWVAIYEDITERHRAEESIAHMARHDALTQLPNRVLLREKMAEGLARIETHNETMAVCYLDLDNFKGVNDTLGHPIGDKLLGIIAARVRGVVGEDDTIARLGGDEFAVLQSNSSADAAGKLARRLVEVISEPIHIDGQEINSSVSIGIALAPNDGSAADHLMKCADLALYRAKAEGRGTFRFFEPDMDARIQARRALEVDLRRALTSGEFSLAYQPQINLAGNELVAMEALLRWHHPQRGPVPPSEFIPLAEETGLIVPLGEWVLREACKDAAQWPESVQGRGQPLAGAVPQSRPRHDGDAGARRGAGCAEPAGAGDHRSGAAAGRRDDRHHAASAACARRAHRDGRFRHRLFVAQLPALVPVRQDQDRPLVHQGHRPQPRQRRDHQGDREPRPKPRDRDHSRRGRDRGTARDRASRRLYRDAGLSGEQAAPGRGSRRSHRAVPAAGCGGLTTLYRNLNVTQFFFSTRCVRLSNFVKKVRPVRSSIVAMLTVCFLMYSKPPPLLYSPVCDLFSIRMPKAVGAEVSKTILYSAAGTATPV